MVGNRPERLDPAFWRGRRVLLTGHTGFKGAWLALMLERLGARLTGLSLAPDGRPNLFELLAPWRSIESVICDVRDLDALGQAVRRVRPEVVIHMAAQALVTAGYADPLSTASTNVMGTVHVLEHLRALHGLAGVLVVTSDKVYENRDAGIAFDENAPLGGHDPYAASKAAAELMTAAYRHSYFDALGIPVLAARAGNVIGGGDWAVNRIVPDLWRAFECGQPAVLRHPSAVRPWQHVLDPLYGYLLYVQRACRNAGGTPPALNFGPSHHTQRTVRQLAERMAACLERPGLWVAGDPAGNVRESHYLTIDSGLAADALGWRAVLDVDQAIDWTGAWYRAYSQGHDPRLLCLDQIGRYGALAGDEALAAGDLNATPGGGDGGPAR